MYDPSSWLLEDPLELDAAEAVPWSIDAVGDAAEKKHLESASV